jgi:hypothetical protein
MKPPFFWTPSKITLVIGVFSLIVLVIIAMYIYLGLVEAASYGGFSKKFERFGLTGI